LSDFKFPEGESSWHFCEGIARSAIGKLKLRECHADPTELANALASSSIQSLELQWLFENSKLDGFAFWNALGTGLGSPSLKELRIKELCRLYDCDNELLERALAAVARGAGNCKKLQLLHMPYIELPMAFWRKLWSVVSARKAPV
jgi:hypothetical protein